MYALFEVKEMPSGSSILLFSTPWQLSCCCSQMLSFNMELLLALHSNTEERWAGMRLSETAGGWYGFINTYIFLCKCVCACMHTGTRGGSMWVYILREVG